MVVFLLVPFTVPTQGLLVILSLDALFGGLWPPVRVNIFAWKASWNRILTIDYRPIERKGMEFFK